MLSFPPFELDIGNQQLWKSGKETHVPRKPFAILRYMVENRQRLVTHEELVGAVWGGNVAMSASLLRTHTCDLRRAVGEGVVETILGRGYRFLPEVKRLELQPRRGDASTGVGAAGWIVVGHDSEREVPRLGHGHELLVSP